MFSRHAIFATFSVWERARVLFNIILFAYVLARFSSAISAMPQKLWSEIFTVAVVANFFYCIAYPIDFITNATDYRHMWQTIGRPALWIALLLLDVAFVHTAIAHLLQGV